MATHTVSIVVTHVMLLIDFEVNLMTKVQLKNEKLYLTTMSFAKKLLEDNAITLDEYSNFNALMIKKYHPIIGTLFTDISLL